ncbi:hypothetical protein N658DRAFT_498238 [Parathielavia hyrcaniae]|uniref:Uncharacterized protein n=1 Tax=Parathielavia hyrcaniae TaxID=113614 RepID=A0AAN6T0A2_9PEZI|nr:hypothetical protein N658DRAFT_498238 [Parathielavia hyrcaniae]
MKSRRRCMMRITARQVGRPKGPQIAMSTSVGCWTQHGSNKRAGQVSSGRLLSLSPLGHHTNGVALLDSAA